MSDESLDRSEAWRLAPLLEVGEAEAQWRDRDLADILAHQLRAPLLFDLGQHEPASQDNISQWSQSAAGPTIDSFADLFSHPHPPLELLTLTKNFAKASDSAAEAPLPSPIATVLYYAAIAAARLRHGTWITELKPRDVRKGLKWAMEQPWLDGRLRVLFQEAKNAIPRE